MYTASKHPLKLKRLKLESAGQNNPFYHQPLAKIYVDELRQSVGQEKWNGETSFFESMKVVFRVGMCLGILPLSGLWQRRWEAVEFRWLSLQTCLTVGIIIGGYTLCLSEFISVTRFTISARSMVKVLYYAMNTTSALLFFRIARKWKLIVRCWHEKEIVFLKKPYSYQKPKLSVKVNRMLFVVLFFTGFVEHFFYQYQSVSSKFRDADYCNVTINNPVNYFLLYEYGNVYRTVPFSLTLGLLVHINNVVMAQIWVFTDLFLIVVCICIRTRFEQLFERIKGAERMASPKFWKDIRMHYIYILDILEVANTHLPAVVFVSCFNNFYFICYQLITLTNDYVPLLVSRIYNRYSLAILIVRMLAVYFYAADVNSAATRPLRLLKDLPTPNWNLEIRRFYDQVRYDSAGLSAMGFFTFNRSIILSVASTIVTYEIVMIQNELNTVYKPSRISFCETVEKLMENILITE